MAKKRLVKEQKAFKFYDTALGHLVLLAIIWAIGFNLFLLAIDSGSLLQWCGVIISLVWGIYHLIEAIKLFIKKLWFTAKKKV